MFGKLISGVIEGVIDTAEIGISVVSDTVKIPFRVLGKADPYTYDVESNFFHHTREKIQEIKERDK